MLSVKGRGRAQAQGCGGQQHTQQGTSRDMVPHACQVCGEGHVHCQAPPVEVT